MANTRTGSTGMHARAGLAALALLACIGWTAPASAQTRISALVNQMPITSVQVAERQAFVRLTQRKNISNREALDLLIDELLVQQEGKRRGVTIPDSDVEERFSAIAGNMNLSTAQLGQALSQSGASARTFKDNIRSQLLQRKLASSLVRASQKDMDISKLMAERKQKGDVHSYRFVLQQIVFVVPAGSSSGYAAQRKNEAEALRRRVNSCDGAVAAIKGMRDVAAKPQVIRMSAQLPSGMRDEMAKLTPGQTMQVSQSDAGMEFLIVCDKKNAPDDNALRQEIQAELMGEQGKDEVQKFVTDLRKKSQILYR
jgi:peptidyl-prolyl cis-trans isomerase SurA